MVTELLKYVSCFKPERETHVPAGFLKKQNGF